MLNARSIQGIIILIIGTFLAIWLGMSIVTSQVETIVQIFAASVLITCISLGRKIWLLIPFMAALGLQFRIPGQPSSLLLGQFLVLGFCTLLLLMRKLPFQFIASELEFWLFVLTALVFQVYVRNPVGVNLFGGDTVGGKGYFLFAISLACALLFCGLRVPVTELKWMLRLSIIGVLINSVISIISGFVPILAYYTGSDTFMESTDAGYENEVVDAKAATRISFLLGLGNNLSLWISSFISPLLACLRPLWAILMVVAIVAAVMSGFRNGIITVGLTFLIGLFYRHGFGGLALATLGVIGGVALLAVVNTLHPLPPNVQRSLTFFPGTWEERYKQDAKGSSEWRFEIWSEVLLTDRWIHNKWMGDGLGFTAAELAMQRNIGKGSRFGISGFDSHRETILSNGDYHSGPVSSIRVVGYIGLIFFLFAQLRLAVHAHRQILRCRGTEWFPLALFLGIPMISGPLIFTFLFGDFKASSAGFLISVGMCRLLQNNLPLPAYIKQSRLPFILQPGNRRNSAEQQLASGQRGV